MHLILDPLTDLDHDTGSCGLQFTFYSASYYLLSNKIQFVYNCIY